jgi:hypothetical protein
LKPPAAPTAGNDSVSTTSPPRPPTFTCNVEPGTTAKVDVPDPPCAPSPATAADAPLPFALAAASEGGGNEPPSAPIASAVTQLTPAGTVQFVVPTVVNTSLDAAPAGTAATHNAGARASDTPPTSPTTRPTILIAHLPRRRSGDGARYPTPMVDRGW